VEGLEVAIPALAQWYRRQTADARGTTRKTMIVALARKLLVAL
jgi:transposase